MAPDFIESLGDAGLCSIEARGHDATRAIYDTILGKASYQDPNGTPPDWSNGYFGGTRCFSSSDQLRTTLICVTGACPRSTALSIRNRWSSSDTS